MFVSFGFISSITDAILAVLLKRNILFCNDLRTCHLLSVFDPVENIYKKVSRQFVKKKEAQLCLIS